MTLTDLLPATPEPDAVFDAFAGWSKRRGLALYPHQEEALIEVVSGANVILSTPTGSGKSLVAMGAHFTALADGRRTFYTAPIKALVSEKFFDLCHAFGPAEVGMMTGDASVNPEAPIICCTAEVLASIALRDGADADVGQVVMDEFHFYADPERGWAWQVPLLELPRAQFVLMSATLGDVTRFEADLTRRTGRPTAVIHSAERPVPLIFSFVTERGRHQDELRPGQLDQRDLPGPAALGVGVEVELIHHHLAHVGCGAVAQRDAGQHLGGAADDRGLRVDAGVPGHHPDLGRAERRAQIEELLRHQRLDRRGVERPPAVRQGGEVGSGCDQRLPRPGGRGQDDVRARDDLDERVLLMRVQGQPAPLRPPGEGIEHRVRVGRLRQEVNEGHKHPTKNQNHLCRTDRGSSPAAFCQRAVPRSWLLSRA